MRKNKRLVGFLIQRLVGFFMFGFSVLILWLNLTGISPADRDGTVCLLLIPAGLYFMFTKHLWFC